MKYKHNIKDHYKYIINFIDSICIYIYIIRTGIFLQNLKEKKEADDHFSCNRKPVFRFSLVQAWT